MITLAREDGARAYVLEMITHAPNPNDMMNLYTSFSWPTLCAEVAKLQITLPDRRPSHIVSTRDESPVGRELRCRTAAHSNR